MEKKEPDFRRIFESLPGAYLILTATPDFIIVAASDLYLEQTLTKRHDIIGKPLFEVFPDNPNDPKADGEQKIAKSFNKVISTKKPDKMEIQKYDIPVSGSNGAEFEHRVWRPVNSPMFDENGKVAFIINSVDDVTYLMDALSDSENQSGFTWLGSAR